jgi:hypothetical protein
MTEQRPGIIKEEISENPNGEATVNRTRLIDFPLGTANYQSASVLNGSELKRMDTTGLKAETPHIVVETAEIAATVLIQDGIGILPGNNESLIFDASGATSLIKQDKEAEKKAKANKKSRWNSSDGSVWSGRSMVSLSGYKGL